MKKQAISKSAKPTMKSGPSIPTKQVQNIQTQNLQVQQQQQQPLFIPKQVNKVEITAQNFSDDEALILKKEQNQVKLENVKQKPLAELEKSIQISLQSLTKAIKLNSKEAQILPIQAQVKTLEDVNTDNGMNNRPSVDLICVIDVSGSMQGQKLELVKYTLKQLGDFLNENDRVCLITFESEAERIIPLKCFNLKNKDEIESKIQQLYARGGTDITKGMNLALKTIKERKFKNDVTSVFLLSDGQDKAAKVGVQNLIKKYEIQDPFTINCYGFGNDHDPELMNGVAQLGDGGFYFVEVLDQVDEMFVDALGGLFSVLAQKVLLTIKLDSKHKHFKNVKIIKTYGDQWKVNQNKENIVALQQLISGVSKEFVFEIEIPPMAIQLMDYERNADFLQLDFEAEINSQKIQKSTQLQLTIYNENEQIVPEVNEEVEVNVIRILAADNMNQARVEADKGNLESGQKMMDQMEKRIKALKPAQQQQLKMLQNDISVCKTALSSKSQYEKVGKPQLIASTKVQMEKRSKVSKFSEECEEEDAQFNFQNSMQQKMVNIQKSKKKM